MSGFLFAILAGALMSIQGVFNTRVSEKIGLLESNVIVQGSALILAIIAMLLFGKGDISKLAECNKVYLLGGVIGFFITITVMLSISDLSPTVAISVILISQLLVAALIDAFGLFGAEKVPFTWTKYVGIALMIIGVIIFKLKR